MAQRAGDPELLDQLLAGGTASAAFEKGGLLDEQKKALTERALNAEMDHHLVGEDGAGNTRAAFRSGLSRVSPTSVACFARMRPLS